MSPQLLDATEATQTLADQIVDVILGWCPGAEARRDRHAINVHASRRFCTVWPVQGHVTVMLTDGENLALGDPWHGAGRNRHVRVRSMDDVTEVLARAVKAGFERANEERA